MADIYKDPTVWVMTSVSLLSVASVCLCLACFWYRNRKCSKSPYGGRPCCCTQPESVVVEVQSDAKSDAGEEEALMRSNQSSQDGQQLSSLEKTVPEFLRDVANSLESLVLQLSLVTKECLPLVLSKDVVHDLLLSMKSTAARLQDIRGLLEDKELSLTTKWPAADTTRITQYLQRIRRSVEAQGLQQLLLKLPQGDNSDCSTAPSLELATTSLQEVTSALDTNLPKQSPLVDNNLRKQSSIFDNNLPARPSAFDDNQAKRASIFDQNQPKQSSVFNNNVRKHFSGSDNKLSQHSSEFENNQPKQFSGQISSCLFRDRTLASHLGLEMAGKVEVEAVEGSSQRRGSVEGCRGSPDSQAESTLTSEQRPDDKRLRNRGLAMEELLSRSPHKQTVFMSRRREHSVQTKSTRPSPVFAFSTRHRRLGPKLLSSYCLEKTTYLTAANCGHNLVAMPNSQSQVLPLGSSTTKSWLSQPLPFPSLQDSSLGRTMKHCEFTSDKTDVKRKRRKDNCPDGQITSVYNNRSPTSECSVAETPSVRNEIESPLVQKVPRIINNPIGRSDDAAQADQAGLRSDSCQSEHSEIQWRPGQATETLRRNRIVNPSVLGKWRVIGDRLQTADGARVSCDLSRLRCQHVTEGNAFRAARWSQGRVASTCADDKDGDNIHCILRRKNEREESAEEFKKTVNAPSDCFSAGISHSALMCDRCSERKQQTDCSLRPSTSETLQRKRGLLWECRSKLHDNVFEVSACSRSADSLDASARDLKESTDTNLQPGDFAGEPVVDNKRKSSTAASFLHEASPHKSVFLPQLIPMCVRASCWRSRTDAASPSKSTSLGEHAAGCCRPLSDIVDVSFVSRAYDASRSCVSDNPDPHLCVFSADVSEECRTARGHAAQEPLNEGFLTDSRSYNRSVSVPHLWRPFATPPRFSYAAHK